jgi:hypothetical protein
MTEKQPTPEDRTTALRIMAESKLGMLIGGALNSDGRTVGQVMNDLEDGITAALTELRAEVERLTLKNGEISTALVNALDDKERMDWIGENAMVCIPLPVVETALPPDLVKFRDAIDAARNATDE